MSLSINLNQIPVHGISKLGSSLVSFASLNSTINRSVLAVVLVDILLLHVVLNRKRISSFFSGFQSNESFPIASDTDDDRAKSTASGDSQRSGKEEKKDRSPISGGDLEVVLNSLGLVFSDGGDVPAVGVGADGIFDIFEERNPGMEEVREAFDVFDSNRDGFIDAEELQKVLCALGLKEGLEMEKCRRMIESFDEDGDGRIDFDEFVKFMEISFN